MATRIAPNSHVYAITVKSEVPIPEDRLRAMLDEVLGEIEKEKATVKTAPAPKRPRVTLRNRTIRIAGRYPCRREPLALHAASIIWPAGVPHKGCGRTFASEAQRTAHEGGWLDVKHTRSWDPKRFPNGCLDAILPLDKRETR